MADPYLSLEDRLMPLYIFFNFFDKVFPLYIEKPSCEILRPISWNKNMQSMAWMR